MTKRRMKPQRRAMIARMKHLARQKFSCPNCGEPGAGHFVPPSLGDKGFFICEKG